MNPSRFDAVARALATGLPRRRFLRRAGAGGAVAVAAAGLITPAQRVVARTGATTASTADCPCTGCSDPKLLCSGDCIESSGRVICPSECKFCKNSFGVAGGGTVALSAGEAILVVAVSAVLDEAGEATDRGLGLVRWSDPTWQETGLTLESVGIRTYGPVAGEEGVRELSGLGLVNGDGPFAFVMRVTDAGGEGRDTVSLTITDEVDAAGFSYQAEGTLLSGDLVGTWTLPEPVESLLPS